MRSGAITLRVALGDEAVSAAVADCLVGRNLRSLSELVTRATLADLSYETARWVSQWQGSVEDLIETASRIVDRSTPSDALDKVWANWVLGLNDKQVQNILRDDLSAVDDHASMYLKTVRASFSPGEGKFRDFLTDDAASSLPREKFGLLTQMLGAQALTIRGSHKSTFGKFWERLILSAVLEVFGFEISMRKEPRVGYYWLNDSREGTRETDAVATLEANHLLHIDIGFIGRGNPEIILDKVTRYGHTRELSGESFRVSTAIIGDKFGEGSNIVARAQAFGAMTAEMASPIWIRGLAGDIDERVRHASPILSEIARADDRRLPELIRSRVPLDLLSRVYPALG